MRSSRERTTRKLWQGGRSTPRRPKGWRVSRPTWLRRFRRRSRTRNSPRRPASVGAAGPRGLKFYYQLELRDRLADSTRFSPSRSSLSWDVFWHAPGVVIAGPVLATSLLGESWRAALPVAPTPALLAFTPVTLVGFFAPLTSVV